MGDDHGTCDVAAGECYCESGWKGVACHVPDCDCNSIPATCTRLATDLKPRCYNCSYPYIGDKCQYRCEHGTENIATSKCICDPCYSGPQYDKLCNGHGTCDQQTGTCDCGFDGWRGDYCDEVGCPGYNENCNGHGTCNLITSECYCNTGWIGIGCHIGKCKNYCSGNGTCLPLDDEPYCDCSPGYFGDDCSSFCDQGTIITPIANDLSSQYCECNACYEGIGCDEECSGHGSCNNSTCDCGNDGWRGTFCEKADCPGLNGVDCS